MKRLTVLTLTLVLTVLVQLSAPPVQAEVSIPDAELAAAIRETLELGEGTPITAAAMRNLTELDASRREIADLTGLSAAVNLTELNLWETAVSDVSALQNLTNLEALSLGNTGVSDISALENLTNLERLWPYNTDVSDISALQNLTNLEALSLGETDVSDISALQNLTNLEALELYGTDVSDISVLQNLTNLRVLFLEDTDVSDISALQNLTNLEGLHLEGTDVSDISALQNLTNLRVLFLEDTDVSDISALQNLTNLERLELEGTDVSDISALQNLTNLERLELEGTAVSDVSPLLGLNLSGTDWDSIGLRLSRCPLSYASIHTHIPALQAKGIEVAFDNFAHPALLKVSGDGQEGEPGAMLETAFVVEAMDEHGEPIVGRTVAFDILGGGGSLGAETVETDAQGKAQVTLTLGSSQGVNKVKASSEGIQSWVLFTAVVTEEVPQLVADVNGDGVVNVQDLVLVAGQFGKTGEHGADVNGDGVVNIQDLVLVAGAFGEGAAAPSVRAVSRVSLTVSDVEGWLIEARGSIRSGSGDASRPGGLSYGRGIAVLERLLASLMPKETVLLANYPNPFNPETWIPYQLSKPAEVTVTIYAANGAIVRTLDLGHRHAGSYDSRGRAAYWDGRNAAGESVASGVYFYTLSAGEFSATRKMVIRK